MSRFIDKLKRMRQAEPQPMGFMTGKANSEKLKMQLVAYAASDKLEKVSGGFDSADASLIEVAKPDDIEALERTCRARDGVPGGGWLKSASPGTLKKVLGLACDFVVFPPSTPLSAIPKDKVGRVLELDTSMSEGLLRTVNDLPVDAVLISFQEESSLTCDSLMAVQRVMYLMNKPVLVPVSNSLAEAELQALWDMGVSGVVVELSDEKSVEKLSELQKAAAKLKPPAVRKKSRLSPMLPGIQPEAPKPAEEEGGEEEDE